MLFSIVDMGIIEKTSWLKIFSFMIIYNTQQYLQENTISKSFDFISGIVTEVKTSGNQNPSRPAVEPVEVISRDEIDFPTWSKLPTSKLGIYSKAAISTDTKPCAQIGKYVIRIIF